MTVTSASAIPAAAHAEAETVSQHIIEIVSDSGEGAQTCGQLFASISAKKGAGVWTVEIIPAEIEPPARSRAGASGNRIRIGSKPVTNAGDEADLVIAFNEQVLYSRIDVGAYREGTLIYLDDTWRNNPDKGIQQQYAEAVADFRERGFIVIETPIEEDCKRFIEDARKGKNMWALGLLCAVYDCELDAVRTEVRRKFARKGETVVEKNLVLL